MRSFDERAATWEDDATKTEQTRGVGVQIERRVGLRPDWVVLEYGAGTGVLGRSIAARVGRVVLVDASAGMVAEARRRIASEGLTNVEAMDAGVEPAPGFACDLLIAAMMLHHVDDVAALLRHFASYVRPGGWLAVADLDADADHSFHDHEFAGHHGFDRDALGALVAAAGFELVTVDTAYQITKQRDGIERDYGVFLLTARRGA